MVPPPPPPVPGARGGATHEVALGARNATATYPIGAALEATIDPAILQGARLKEANGARVEGGRVVVDVLLERGGATLAHPVTLVPRAPQVVQAPAPPPPPAPTPWSLVGASAILGGAIGTLAGVFVGWLLL
jgi:hypothetical protein